MHGAALSVILVDGEMSDILTIIAKKGLVALYTDLLEESLDNPSWKNSTDVRPGHGVENFLHIEG